MVQGRLVGEQGRSGLADAGIAPATRRVSLDYDDVEVGVTETKSSELALDSPVSRAERAQE